MNNFAQLFCTSAKTRCGNANTPISNETETKVETSINTKDVEEETPNVEETTIVEKTSTFEQYDWELILGMLTDEVTLPLGAFKEFYSQEYKMGYYVDESKDAEYADYTVDDFIERFASPCSCDEGYPYTTVRWQAENSYMEITFDKNNGLLGAFSYIFIEDWSLEE